MVGVHGGGWAMVVDGPQYCITRSKRWEKRLFLWTGCWHSHWTARGTQHWLHEIIYLPSLISIAKGLITSVCHFTGRILYVYIAQQYFMEQDKYKLNPMLPGNTRRSMLCPISHAGLMVVPTTWKRVCVCVCVLASACLWVRVCECAFVWVWDTVHFPKTTRC